MREETASERQGHNLATMPMDNWRFTEDGKTYHWSKKDGKWREVRQFGTGGNQWEYKP